MSVTFTAQLTGDPVDMNNSNAARCWTPSDTPSRTATSTPGSSSAASCSRSPSTPPTPGAPPSRTAASPTAAAPRATPSRGSASCVSSPSTPRPGLARHLGLTPLPRPIRGRGRTTGGGEWHPAATGNTPRERALPMSAPRYDDNVSRTVSILTLSARIAESGSITRLPGSPVQGCLEVRGCVSGRGSRVGSGSRRVALRSGLHGHCRAGAQTWGDRGLRGYRPQRGRVRRRRDAAAAQQGRPSEGTVTDFEVWWVHRHHQQVRLKPSDPQYLCEEFRRVRRPLQAQLAVRDR